MASQLIKDGLMGICEKYIEGKIPLEETAIRIDDLLEGTERVIFKEKKSFTVGTYQKGMFSLPYQEFGNGTNKMYISLAIALYKEAIRNGSIRPGELHMDKTISTKHHCRKLRSM